METVIDPFSAGVTCLGVGFLKRRIKHILNFTHNICCSAVTRQIIAPAKMIDPAMMIAAMFETVNKHALYLAIYP